MSTFNDIDITCEECGEDFQGTVWTAVHTGEDPELKELLLGGELNLVMCPHCAKVAFQDHFLLYQDPDAELVAYVYPLNQQDQAAKLHKLMLSGFKEAQRVYPVKDRIAYEPILFFGLESLVKLLVQEEVLAEQSQIAGHVCEDNDISFTLLRPHVAREKDIVRVIPSNDTPASTQRDSVLKGIDRLLQINPALDVYQNIRERVQADPQWRI